MAVGGSAGDGMGAGGIGFEGGAVMTKIEIYKAKKAIAERVSQAVHWSLGRDGPSNDKHSVTVRFQKIQNAQWTPMQFAIEMCHGYYGSLSCYSDTSEDMGRYLAKAIEKHATMLLDAAVEMAKADAEKARLNAEDEAREVLGESAA
jgi:hypothetical protein